MTALRDRKGSARHHASDWVTVAYKFGAQAHLFLSLAAHLNLVAAAVVLLAVAAIAIRLLRRGGGEASE